jgi:hypothetical protein
MLEAGRRMPPDRHAAIITIGDVERPVDEHREAQPGAGAELQHANTAFNPVFERHQAHAGELGQRPRKARHIPPRQRRSIKLNHAYLSRSILFGIAAQSGQVRAGDDAPHCRSACPGDCKLCRDLAAPHDDDAVGDLKDVMDVVGHHADSDR